MRNKIAYRLWTVLVVMSMAACSDSDIMNVENGQDEYLIGVTDFDYYESSGEFLDFISSSITDIGSDYLKKTLLGVISLDDLHKLVSEMYEGRRGDGRTLRMERYNFIYRSADPSGRPVTLSGALMLPNTKNKSAAYMIDDITLYNQYWIDANHSSTMIGAPPMLRAVYNQAVVTCDYEGFGYDCGKHHHPFLEYFALARQSIDCQMAAFELMDHLGIELRPGYGTYNMGFSKGAPVAMAVQKMLENSEPAQIRDKIRLKSSYCATGPYNLTGLAQEYLERGESEHLWMLTMLVMSAYYSYPDRFEGYQLEDFFTDELNKATIEHDGVTYSLCGWVDAGITYNKLLQKRYAELGIEDIHQIFAPRFFDQDGNLNVKDPLLALLMEIWEHNNPSAGWSPQAPILIEHSTYDNFVVYDLSYQSYLDLRNHGGEINENVSEHTYNIGLLTHREMSILSMMRLLIMPDPALDGMIDFMNRH